MTKQKSTKRALLASVLSLVLCVSMLVGSTFAWFTDSATTGVNKIVSGNLDIKLSYKNAADTDYSEVSANTTDLFVNKDGGAILWEPGAASICYFKIENLGTLNLKYVMSVLFEDTVTANGGAIKLSDALVSAIVPMEEGETFADSKAAVDAANGTDSVTALGYANDANPTVMAPNATDYFAMVVYMPETVGNDYNVAGGLAIELYINLVATQAAVESDSYGSTYDTDAPNLYSINGVKYATLMEAIAAANEGDEITISGTAEYDFGTASNQTIDAKGITISGIDNTTLVFSGDGANNTFGNVTLKNLTVVDKTTSYAEGAWEFGYLELMNVTAENVIFNNGVMLDSASTFTDNGCSFTDCTFTGKTESGLKMYGAWVNSGSATFTDCTFIGTRGLKMHEAYGSEIATVTVDGCTFDGMSEKPGIAIGDLNADTTVTVKNSIFDEVQPGDQGKFIYESDTAVDAFTFVEENNKVIYVVTIDSVEDFVAFANAVTNNTKYQDKIVANNSYVTTLLNTDVDLTGVTGPAANANQFAIGNGSNTHYDGTFDGQGHTISNYTIAGNWTYNRALFRTVAGKFTFKNVIFDTVVNKSGVGVENTKTRNIGVVCGLIGNGNVTFENITIKNAELEGSYGTAFILGGVNGGTVNMINCKVEDSSITTKYHYYNETTFAAGMLFANLDTTYGGAVGTISGNTVSNVTWTAMENDAGVVTSDLPGYVVNHATMYDINGNAK